MKKRAKKIVLSRETLRRLDDADLEVPAGGASMAGATTAFLGCCYPDEDKPPV